MSPGPQADAGASSAPVATGGAATGPAASGGLGLRLTLLATAMALAAVNTGNNLIYLMLSLVLALALVGALLGRRAARALRVKAHLPEEARAGEPFTVHFEATGRFPLLPGTVVVARVTGLPEILDQEIGVPHGGGRGVASARVTVDQRGIHDDLTVTARTGYPFNLTWFRARPSRAAGVVVLPRFQPIRALQVGGTRPAQTALRAATYAARGAGTEVLDRREHTPEDDARHIDWRASARARRLMVREFEREDVARDLEVVIDTEAPDDPSFEVVVSSAAAILDFAERHGHRARLLTPDAGPLNPRAAMRWLAGARRAGAPAARKRAPAAAPHATHAPPRDACPPTRSGTERIVVSAERSRATPLRMIS